MTDAEKALLWARRSDVPVPHQQRVAEAYLVGAAASADRIKELEARVAELTEEVEDLRATNEALGLPEGSVLVASFEWPEGEEPTNEDAYGWGCQGWGDPR